jgi:propionyl-CoA carboxylase beta chain
MTDFTMMVDHSSYMFVTGPEVVKTVTNEVITAEELGGSYTHTRKSGVAHLSAANDLEAMASLRVLVGYLPSSNRDTPPVRATEDVRSRQDPALGRMVPADPNVPYDMGALVRRVLDDGALLEISPDFAKNILTGFGRMEGGTVGVVANQPQELAGCLDIDASIKAARFVRFCDCFNIPILTFVDVPGFLPGRAQEHDGIIRNGAKLLFAYAEATVPKVPPFPPPPLSSCRPLSTPARLRPPFPPHTPPNKPSPPPSTHPARHPSSPPSSSAAPPTPAALSLRRPR